MFYSSPHYPTIAGSAMTNDDHSAIRSSTQVRVTMISLYDTVSSVLSVVINEYELFSPNI